MSSSPRSCCRRLSGNPRAPGVRAWVLRQAGSIDAGSMVLVGRPVPEPGMGEIRVWVVVRGVCRTDLHLAEGDFPPRGADVVPGHEIVGVVEKLWRRHLSFRDRRTRRHCLVAGHMRGCRFCKRGDENLCLAPRFTGWDADGGYAEHAVVDERFVSRCLTPSRTRRRHRCCVRGSSVSGRYAGPTYRRGRLDIYGFGGSADLAAPSAAVCERARACPPRYGRSSADDRLRDTARAADRREPARITDRLEVHQHHRSRWIISPIRTDSGRFHRGPSTTSTNALTAVGT